MCLILRSGDPKLVVSLSKSQKVYDSAIMDLSYSPCPFVRGQSPDLLKDDWKYHTKPLTSTAGVFYHIHSSVSGSHQ